MTTSDKIKLFKGFYSLYSTYGSKDNGIDNFPKRGSEIKLGLGKMIDQITKRKSELLDDMNLKLGEIAENYKVSPDTDFSMDNNEYVYQIDFIPKKFDYNTIYNGVKCMDTSSGIEQQVVKPFDPMAQQSMRMYNDIAYNYMDLCVSKIKIEALRRNIVDEKTYNLTVEQLAILGL
jgi:hypothetical protein